MGSWITSSKFLTSERLFWKRKFNLKIQAVNNTRIVSQRKRGAECRRTVGSGQKRRFGAPRGRVGASESTRNSQPLISGFSCVLMSKCYPSLLLLILPWCSHGGPKKAISWKSAYPSFSAAEIFLLFAPSHKPCIFPEFTYSFSFLKPSTLGCHCSGICITFFVRPDLFDINVWSLMYVSSMYDHWSQRDKGSQRKFTCLHPSRYLSCCLVLDVKKSLKE